jgi:hypothetical protein
MHHGGEPGSAIVSHMLILGAQSAHRLPAMQCLPEAQGQAGESWTGDVKGRSLTESPEAKRKEFTKQME